MIDGYNVTVFTRPSPVLQQSVASWGFNMGLKVRTHLRGADSCTVARLSVEVRPNWSWKDMDVAGSLSFCQSRGAGNFVSPRPLQQSHLLHDAPASSEVS